MKPRIVFRVNPLRQTLENLKAQALEKKDGIKRQPPVCFGLRVVKGRGQ